MLIKAISQALTQKGLTRYKLSKATDIAEISLSVYLRHGHGIGAAAAEKIISTLDIWATDGTTATQQWRSAITAAMRNEGKTAYGYAKANGIAPAALINYLKGGVNVSLGKTLTALGKSGWRLSVGKPKNCHFPSDS